MDAILAIFGWYAAGLSSVWLVARSGHDPLPWALAGWLGGALTLVAALCFLAHESWINRHRVIAVRPHSTPLPYDEIPGDPTTPRSSKADADADADARKVPVA